MRDVTAGTVAAIAAARLLPQAVLTGPGSAEPLAAALLAGGVRCVEISVRTGAAAAAIRAMARLDRLVVGAGSVLTPAEVDLAVRAGARFVTSPGLTPAVVRRCLRHRIAVFAGVATATEIQAALEAGLDTVGFFPAAQLGGPAMLRALGRAFPGVRFIPSGGVGPGDLEAYLAVEAVLAAGMTWMVAADLIGAGRWAEVTRRTAAAVAVARAAVT